MYIFQYRISTSPRSSPINTVMAMGRSSGFVPLGNSESKCSFYGLSAVVNVVSFTVVLKISSWGKLQGVIIEPIDSQPILRVDLIRRDGERFLH